MPPGMGAPAPPPGAANAEPTLPGPAESLASASAGEVARPGFGYLDSAVPFTNVRLRFDAAFDDPFPDRGEYFYAKCGCFNVPNAKGPPNPESNVNYQEYTTYLEYAPTCRGSFFVELPLESVQFKSAPGFTNNPSATGFGDMNFGFKYALLADPCQYFTFQLRTYCPTGDPAAGLGTDHFSVEPGLLYFKSLGDRLTVEAEFKDWIPIAGASDFESNVLNYGAGVGYAVCQTQNCALTPLLEVVGWTFLGGQMENIGTINSDGGAVSASGTIVNVKIGARLTFGGSGIPPYNERSSLYVGWGHAVTDQVLYRDIVRAEYRIVF
jgi:hypothetical protein